MRYRAQQNGLTITAVAGTTAVLLSFDMKEADAKGLLGFYIKRTNHTDHKTKDVLCNRFFQETVAHPKYGGIYSTRYQPWQSFLWEDFSVNEQHDYEYFVTAVYGTPSNLEYRTTCTIRLTLPAAKDNKSEVYFNRGVAGSQAYAREFNNKKPSDMDEAERQKAYQWLSRGLEEALVAFIRQAKDKDYSLRCSFYEFRYQPILKELKDAFERGADVKIVYDARKEKKHNEEAIKLAGLPKKILKARTKSPNYISHNKFMVLLKDKKPVAVWSGSTNITEKGIFGQSNVGFIIRDEVIAGKYLQYWDKLHTDPDMISFKATIDKITPDPSTIQQGIIPLFSPRKKLAVLNTYASLINGSKQVVCGMFPFSFNKSIKSAVTTDTDFIKYIIIDKRTKNTSLVTNDVDNVIIYGGAFKDGLYDWLKEINAGKLFGSGVNYIHDKIILVDPLTDDPIVISGSANFSDNSILRNDENTVVIRGDLHVADIYFTEFARVFNHYASRQSTIKKNTATNITRTNPNYLQPDYKKWVPAFYKKVSLKYKRKKMFSDMKVK